MNPFVLSPICVKTSEYNLDTHDAYFAGKLHMTRFANYRRKN